MGRMILHEAGRGEARRGSAIQGNTWHGSYKKNDVQNQLKEKNMAAAKKQVKTVEIEAMEIGRVEYDIVGIDPGLLMHRFSEKTIAKMEKTQAAGPKRATKSPRDPDTEVDDALYKLSTPRDGTEFGFPVTGIKLAMVHAGGRLTGMNMTDLRALFFIDSGPDGFVPIKGEWEKHTAMVRVGKGSSDIRYRPLFPGGWRARIGIEYNANLITADVVGTILQMAGYAIGIGDWRPEKNGPYGRFGLATLVDKDGE